MHTIMVVVGVGVRVRVRVRVRVSVRVRVRFGFGARVRVRVRVRGRARGRFRVRVIGLACHHLQVRAAHLSEVRHRALQLGLQQPELELQPLCHPSRAGGGGGVSCIAGVQS